MVIYLVGSLRNPKVPEIAQALRGIHKGIEVIDDWYAAGPEADDRWREYEIGRGRDYTRALEGLHAEHVFSFDKYHLDRADGCVMVLPAGKSGHLEFGYVIGQGKWGMILLEDPNPDRWDIMYQFATGVYRDLPSLLKAVDEYREVPF